MPGAPIQTKVTATITATLTWEGSYPPRACPSTLSLKVSSKAVAYGYNATLLVDNGFSDDPKVTASNGGNVTQNGIHIVTVPVQNNKAVFTKTISASDVGSGGATIELAYSVTPDTRSVQITSPSFIDANKKNWRLDCTTAGNVRAENKRNFDGSITVDSVMDWILPRTDSSGNYTRGHFYHNNTFDAVAPGFSTPYVPYRPNSSTTYDWSNTGPGGMSSKQPPYPPIALFGLTSDNLYPKSGDSDTTVPSTPTVVKVRLQDLSDNAKGENIFTILWHKKIEAELPIGQPINYSKYQLSQRPWNLHHMTRISDENQAMAQVADDKLNRRKTANQQQGDRQLSPFCGRVVRSERGRSEHGNGRA